MLFRSDLREQFRGLEGRQSASLRARPINRHFQRALVCCPGNNRTKSDPDPTTGIISGFVYGQDQIFCGNINSAEWLVTQYKASNQAGGVPQYYCLNLRPEVVQGQKSVLGGLPLTISEMPPERLANRKLLGRIVSFLLADHPGMIGKGHADFA